MKTPKEVLRLYYNSTEDLQLEVTLNPSIDILERLIGIAQKEAWNEAIDKAAHKAHYSMDKSGNSIDVTVDQIFKLKK